MPTAPSCSTSPTVCARASRPLLVALTRSPPAKSALPPPVPVRQGNRLHLLRSGSCLYVVSEGVAGTGGQVMKQYNAQNLVVHPGNAPEQDVIVEVTPELAGWDYIRFQVRRLAPRSEERRVG